MKDSDFSTSFNSLELFAFGTYTDYAGTYADRSMTTCHCQNEMLSILLFCYHHAANRDTYLELSEAQVSKLKHLTVASLASSSSSKVALADACCCCFYWSYHTSALQHLA